jgi:hypothetical protein
VGVADAPGQDVGTPLAIARTTPALCGRFALVTPLAHPHCCGAAPPRPCAWHRKPLPTFADALALVRREVWTARLFQPSLLSPDHEHIPQTLLDHLGDLLCSAA